MINRTRTLFFRAVSFTMCFGLLNLSMPMSMVVQVGTPIRQRVEETAKEAEAKQRDLAKRRLASTSRPLTTKEQHAFQGRTGENPYLAGQNKWDVVYKGVNLMTGNFTTSATDMSFEGGYGIPVNVTRSYSANNPDEGPFGKGWTLSADVRSTAGGVLKSASAPVRSVPLSIKERPTLQLDDPNAETANGVLTQPVSAVIATDAGGKEETIQRDVDGILTTPPWDKNTSEPVYEWVTLNGASYQILKSNKVTTPDGTVYTYTKLGTYPNGTVPWNNPTATPEAANVLKVSQAVDRQGNTTFYSYTTTKTVSFQKSNGLVTENPISYVKMPNGHQITFVWGDGSTGHPTNRIWKIRDNGSVRTVVYSYTTSGLLSSVTTPGGKTTTYGYGSSSIFAGDDAVSPRPSSNDLLISMTDPRGLQQKIAYEVANVEVKPFGYWQQGINTTGILWPNGTVTTFRGPTAPAGVSVAWDHDSTKTVSYNRLMIHFFSPNSGTVGMTCSPRFTDAWNIGEDPWERLFSVNTQDLVRETRRASTRILVNDLDWMEEWVPEYGAIRNLSSNGLYGVRSVVTDKSYNFMGQPLTVSTTESTTTWLPPSTTTERTTTTAYSYWGKDKYYQSKATKDQSGRYSYTDYYDNLASVGKRGQTYRVYNSAFTSFYEDTSLAVPAGTPSDKAWKYRLEPTDAATYAAQFDYDSKGRPIDVWKLQGTGPWSYVRTHTDYGSDTDGSWGQASQVVEDYGGVNRTTQTLHYTSWGKADRVLDAKGQIFQTDYDLDGQVNSVTRQDSGLNQAVVTYTYGGTPGTISYGQPVSVVDGLSGVSQTIAYYPAGSGGATGQVSSVSEAASGSSPYTVSYTYNAAGDRETVRYDTDAGMKRWGYYDYLMVGDPTSGSRVFQTMTALDSAGLRTSEEFHYSYDSLGRLRECAFAQTPSAPARLSNGGWYDGSNQASRRARAVYLYDSGGRLADLQYYWDVWGGSSYASEAVLRNSCGYELTGLNRGLKTQSKFWTRQTPGSPNWTLARTETYGYDASRDYLISADYGDGLPNQTVTWSYDAAGNRNDAVTDNLNRATSLGGVAVTHDILGNRLSKGTITYTWDALNRMTSLYNGSVTTNYTYRADGMRVSKSSTSGSTTYRYDGQMGMQDVDTSGSTTTVTNYALGARGVDMIERVGTSTVTGFPIYDAHGNNIATLTRSGSTYAIGDQRSYDAWGGVRTQQSSGDPSLRYCATLGHRQDDESGLIYARSRYYDQTMGRFVSEDSAKAGTNWYSYCSNDPQNRIDVNGEDDDLPGISAAVSDWLKRLGLSKLAVSLLDKMFLDGWISKLCDRLKDLGKELMKNGVKELDYAIIELGASRAGGSAGQTGISGLAINSARRGVIDVIEGACLFMIAQIIDIMK